MDEKKRLPKPLLSYMRPEKPYALMELVKDTGLTRQRINSLLNEFLKKGDLRREGTRKRYRYFKLRKKPVKDTL